jgi:N-acetylglutamate synthase-like GNAT family acetyltransferase
MDASDKKPMSYAIRTAKLTDAHAIFDLIRDHQGDLLARPLGDIIQNIDRFLVCEAAGAVAGCASWQILPEVGDPSKAVVEVQSVAVRKELRRRGAGKALVTAVLKRVRPLAPAQAIVLTFAPEFFASLGFREVPKTQLMHKIYIGCMACTKYTNPFTCPEIAMALDLRV